MIEGDTIKLLRECDAGIKMGVAAIDEVSDHVQHHGLAKVLNECRDKHTVLAEDIDRALENFGDDGKAPNPMARGMSWLKTNVEIAFDESDSTIADLMTDGCNMGVKSLSRYLNQYAAADEDSKDIAKRLINLEEQLAVDMRDYL